MKQTLAAFGAASLIIAATLSAQSTSSDPTSPAATPRAFGGIRAAAHVAPIAPYRFVNTILRIRFNIARGIVYGHETVVVRPKHAGLQSLPFNSLGIAYQRVALDGKPVSYAQDRAHALVVLRLSKPTTPSTPLTFDFAYTARPQAGVYFVRPDAAYPHLTPQIWSQGEPQDNRRWFPTWDEPNEKTPSELVLTVPRGWIAVANGYLHSQERNGASETWDWRAPRPKAPYLIAFVAGPLSKHHTSLGDVRDEDVARYGNGWMDVDSFVPPPYGALNATCLGNTNRIVAYFQKLIGARFPWEKYDQTTAERYVFGGMEDTSATILTTRALHPLIENVERPCDVLVAHELAQQWYGDDASWADFSEVWLGEGFATYFDELWSAKRYGPAQFEYERYRAQQTYFAETLDYARPIVENIYADPIQVFDASSHERPAQVLHTLRAMFGDARFFAALGAYYREYRGRYATTHGFFTSIERSLGTNLDWFEREWFYRSDVPRYVVTQRYDIRTSSLSLDVVQDNPTGKPFRMPITVEAFVGSRIIRKTSLVDRNLQTIVIAGIPETPDMVLFDPDATILSRVAFAKSPSDLAYQLAHARHVGDREWALGELAKLKASQGVAHDIALRAVSNAALSDPFYGVRADAATVAGAFGDGATVEAALHDTDARVRLSAADAATNPAAASVAVMRGLNTMATDPDPVQAAVALKALGALKAPETYAVLVAALARPSYDERVASGALSGLAAYGDARALPLLQSLTAYGTAESERNAAIAALGQLALRTHSVQSVLPGLLHIAETDPLIASRLAATNAVGAVGDMSASATLERIAHDDTQPMVRLAAEERDAFDQRYTSAVDYSVLHVRRNGLADQVIDSVRMLIRDGTYLVGDRLPAEAALCALFGVGRSTLREAMRVLANRGLVDVRHGEGTFIAAAVPRESLEERLDRAELAEIYEARMHLEVPLAALAAERRDARDVQAMRSALRERERAIRSADVAKYAEGDFAFHRTIAKAAKNAALLGLYESFVQAVEARLAAVVTPQYLQAENDHLHDELCEAIARRDRRAAQRLATVHLKTSLDNIGRLLP